MTFEGFWSPVAATIRAGNRREVESVARAAWNAAQRTITSDDGKVSVEHLAVTCAHGLPSELCAKHGSYGMGHELRPEVLAFARLMEAKLRENDHKGGWKDDYIDWLFMRLVQEVGELAPLVSVRPKHPEPPDTQRIASEAADVANFAMMIADVCGALGR